MKKLGSELRITFGAPRFKDRQSKYFVERKSELIEQINPFNL